MNYGHQPARKGPWTRIAIGVAALAVIFGAVSVYRVWNTNPAFPTATGTNTNDVTSTATPTNTNDATNGAEAKPAGSTPFAGTPAENWQEAPEALVMPAAAGVGPFTTVEVSGALSRARAYLLAARTDAVVLQKHNLAVLAALASSSATADQAHLFANYLAPGNSLAAPVRLAGSVTMSFVPQAGTAAEHLVVAGNLIWAYALNADYPVEPGFGGVVTEHEHISLAFYLDAGMDGPEAKVTPQEVESSTYSMDCRYHNQGLLGLPRTNDPDRIPTLPTTALSPYSTRANVTAPGVGCRTASH